MRVENRIRAYMNDPNRSEFGDSPIEKQSVKREDIQKIQMDVNEDGILDAVYVDTRNMPSLTPDQLMHGVVAIDLNADGTDNTSRANLRRFQRGVGGDAQLIGAGLDVLQTHWKTLSKDGKMEMGVLMQISATGKLPNGEEAPAELIDAARFFFSNPAILRALDQGQGDEADGVISDKDIEAARAWQSDIPMLAELTVLEPQVFEALSDDEFALATEGVGYVLFPLLSEKDQEKIMKGEGRKVRFDYNDLAMALVEYGNSPDANPDYYRAVYALITDPVRFAQLESGADKEGDVDGVLSWADLEQVLGPTAP